MGREKPANYANKSNEYGKQGKYSIQWSHMHQVLLSLISLHEINRILFVFVFCVWFESPVQRIETPS